MLKPHVVAVGGGHGLAATIRAARRYAGRYIPFVGAPLGALQNAGVTKGIGKRALAYYGVER